MKSIHDITNFDYSSNSRCTCKKPEATISFVNFSKAFDSIHSGKMEQILLAYSLPKETVAAIIMLYKNMKVKVHSLDRDTDYFNIIAGVLQGDTLAPNLFIICLDYVLKTSIDIMKDNSFKLAKERSRRYPAQTITGTDYADDIALLANTPAQAETLLHSLKRAAGGIGLHVNTDKTEYMCFNQETGGERGSKRSVLALHHDDDQTNLRNKYKSRRTHNTFYQHPHYHSQQNYP